MCDSAWGWSVLRPCQTVGHIQAIQSHFGSSNCSSLQNKHAGTVQSTAQRTRVRPRPVHCLEGGVGAHRHKARGVYDAVGRVNAADSRRRLFGPAKHHGWQRLVSAGPHPENASASNHCSPLQASNGAADAGQGSTAVPPVPGAHWCSSSKRKKGRGSQGGNSLAGGGGVMGSIFRRLRAGAAAGAVCGSGDAAVVTHAEIGR